MNTKRELIFLITLGLKEEPDAPKFQKRSNTLTGDVR